MLIYRESNQKNLVSKRNSKFNVPKLNPSTLKNKPWKLNLVLGPNIRWTLFGIECETDDFSRLPIGMMYQSHHFFFFMIIWLYANLETMSRFHNSIMLIGEDDRQTLERKGSLELCWSKYFLLWATEVKRCQGGGVYPLHQLQTTYSILVDRRNW